MRDDTTTAPTDADLEEQIKRTKQAPHNEVRTDAAAQPDARVLALEVGAYGHSGAATAMFWYRTGGVLHAHRSALLKPDMGITDQLDFLEAWAADYPEYWRIPPVVAIGVTVLSAEGRRLVRRALGEWVNPPRKKKLVSISDYAGEHAGPHPMSRQKLRDLIGERMADDTIGLTAKQKAAVRLYTGKRAKPQRDADTDTVVRDDIDAMALPPMLACVAARSLLPKPLPSDKDRSRRSDQIARAWQLATGCSWQDAQERAARLGHPARMHTP